MRKGITIAVIMSLAVIFACGEKLTEEQLSAKVQDYQEKQQWEDVAGTYETLLKSYPESKKAAEYMYNLGMVYSNNLKEYEKAINTWKKLLEKYPDSRLVTNTKFMIGYCYANEVKDLDQAREEYNKFLSEHPNHELVPSVKWELKHLGQDIKDIELEFSSEQAE